MLGAKSGIECYFHLIIILIIKNIKIFNVKS